MNKRKLSIIISIIFILSSILLLSNIESEYTQQEKYISSSNGANITPTITNWTHWENSSWYSDPIYDTKQDVWLIEKDTLEINYENCKVTYENPLHLQAGYDNNTEHFDCDMSYQWMYRINGEGFDMRYSVKYFSYEEPSVTDYNYVWFFNETIPSYTTPVVKIDDNVSIVSFNVTYDNCIRHIYDGYDPLESVEYNVSIIFGYHIWYNGTQVNVKIDQDIFFNYLNYTLTPQNGKFQITNEYRIQIGDDVIYPSTGTGNSVYYEMENKTISNFIMNPTYDVFWNNSKKSTYNITYIVSTDEEPEGYFISEFRNLNWSTERVLYDPTIELNLAYFSEFNNNLSGSIPFNGLCFSFIISIAIGFFVLKRKINMNK